jgi:hypothetical protein
MSVRLGGEKIKSLALLNKTVRGGQCLALKALVDIGFEGVLRQRQHKSNLMLLWVQSRWV